MMSAVVMTGAARGHVILAQPDAAPGARYVAHFKVGHGCSASPTVALTVSIPPGVTRVAPETSAGWKISTTRKNGHVTSITWEGGVVPADKSGVFAVAMTLPTTEGTLAFPTIQKCASGEEHWADVGVEQSKRPAPLLRVAKQNVAPSSLVLSDGWFRALPPTVPSGAYFTLRNAGTRPVTLIGANSPACGTLMIHESETRGGVSSMSDMQSVNIPPGGQARFAPGSYHLMCTDAKPLLKVGSKVQVTLSFKEAPPLTALFDVRNAAGE